MTPPVPEQYLNITNHNDELNDDVLFKMINQLDISNPAVSSSNSNNNKNGNNSSNNNSGSNKHNNSSGSSGDGGQKKDNSTNSSSLLKLQEAISTQLFMVLW